MKSFQVKGKEREELEQLYNNLQQDWDAYKQSNPTTSGRYSADSNIAIKFKAIQLLNNSPRDLMSKLQQHLSPLQAWKAAGTKDLAAQEICRERRATIESGNKWKGRRLFEPMEGGGICDGWNTHTDMGQHSEVRSLSFCYSEDESNGSKGLPDCTRCSYSSSSSSSLCLSVDKDEEVKALKGLLVATVAETRVVHDRPSNEGRYKIFVGGLAIALLIFAMCMRSARSFGGYEVILVPT